MRKGFVVIVLFLMMLLAPSVGAETFAVSPGGLTAALAQAKDGDILELADGYYGEPEETFPLTVARGVTIRPQEGAHPVVDAPAMKVAFRVEADGVTIQGLEIRFRRTGLYLIGDNVTVEDCSILLADPAWRTSSCGAWMGGIRGRPSVIAPSPAAASLWQALRFRRQAIWFLCSLACLKWGSPVISSPPTPSPTVQLTGSPCSMPPGSRALWRRRMRGRF